MGNQRHQPAVAPALAFAQPIGGQRLTAFAFQNVAQRLIPAPRLCLLVLHVPVHRGIARDIVGHAGRRVQVDGLERPHEGPAQAQPVLDRLVHILGAGIAIGDQLEGFGQQGALQPVQDEAGNLLLHQDRHHARLLIERAGPRHHLGIGPGGGRQFDDGHQMRRVGRMRHQAARPAIKILGEQRSTDVGGGGGENRSRIGDAVHHGEDLLLRFFRLFHIFLHIGGTVQRLLQRGGGRYPRLRGSRIVQQPAVVQLLQRAINQPEGGFQRRLADIVELHAVAGPREADRPGPPDQPAADHGDCHSLSSHRACFLLLRGSAYGGDAKPIERIRTTARQAGPVGAADRSGGRGKWAVTRTAPYW